MSKTKYLALRFNIYDRLRFLSHKETMTMFARALTRAQIEVSYSQGFNPRPKISLPLPRTVGVESYGDLLVLAVEPGANSQDICEVLAKQLCKGCEIVDVFVSEKKISPRPVQVEYEIPLPEEISRSDLSRKIEQINGDDQLEIQRQGGKVKNKRIKVSDFLRETKLEPAMVRVVCDISQAGTLRVEEILNILDLARDRLAGAVRRKSVKWIYN